MNIKIDPQGRPQSRPVVITIFTQSVRPSQNFKLKLQSLPTGPVGWPSGSLTTPVLLPFVFVETSELKTEKASFAKK